MIEISSRKTLLTFGDARTRNRALRASRRLGRAMRFDAQSGEAWCAIPFEEREEYNGHVRSEVRVDPIRDQRLRPSHAESPA
jgi:hypothetical protein